MATNETSTSFENVDEKGLRQEFNNKCEVSVSSFNCETVSNQDEGLDTEIPQFTTKVEHNENREVKAIQDILNSELKIEKGTNSDANIIVEYKDKHKIGSRKASEGVITYNEPMYQSLVNSMVDNVKRTSLIKCKNADNKRSKSLNSSPVKRKKTDFERSLSFESAIKVKKKIIDFETGEKHEKHNKYEKTSLKEKKLLLEEIEKCTKIVNEKVAKRAAKREQKKANREQKRTEQKNANPEHKKEKLQKSKTRNIDLPGVTKIKQLKNQKQQIKKTHKKTTSAETESVSYKKDKSPKNKANIAHRRLKREASLNAVTFMNLLYVKEDSSPSKPTDHTSKRSKSETDLQTVVKKQKRHSTPESLAAFEETIYEVIQNIRAENTINEVVDKVRIEISDADKATNSMLIKGIKKQNSDGQNLEDEVFQRDKFDLIKIKASEAKIKKQAAIKSVKTPVMTKKTKVIGQRSPEEIAEKRRKASLARLKKAKEILKHGKIKNFKSEADSKKEKELLNMKLSKLSVILKRKQKRQEKENKDKLPRKAATRRKDIASDQNKARMKKTEDNILKGQESTENETCRSARTHVESPKRVIRPSSCQCCQSYYQNQGNSFWSNRNVMNRGSFSQEPCPLGSYSQEQYHNNAINIGIYNQEPCPSTSSELPSSPTVDIHPYSSPTHVPVVDNSPFVGQLMPTHFPQCNSCTCVHGAMMSAPCPQCAVGGVPVLTCHHQGFSNAYPVTFPHNHGTYPHCGSYCASGSFHPSSSPMIHQTITAETPFLVRHSLPLQLPHESSHPMPVQLSHGERPPPITHPVSHADVPSMHLSHVYSLSHSELPSATTVNAGIPADQDLIDVGHEEFTEVVSTENQTIRSTSNDTTIGSSKVKTSSSKHSSNNESVKENRTKSIDLKPKRLKSVEEKPKIENTKLKRKKSVSQEKFERTQKKETGTKKKDPVKKMKVKEEKKEVKKKERKKSGGNKENAQKSVSVHGWIWEGEPEFRTVTSIFDGKQVKRKCYKAIKHDDGDIVHIKDCVLVCAGAQNRDMPYVAKVTNFWEEPDSGEMMMSLLWYYRPEHTETGRQPNHKDCEVFAAKHRDESPVACIDDRCYVLTYNEYCRFMAEVTRTKYDLPPRKKVVPDSEEPYPCRRIPPVDLDPENVLLCRHVYDFKLKRVLKNPS